MTARPPPTLALCVPACDAARTLPRLLLSARRQTIPFDEVLVYDDASTDDTAAVARSLGATVVRGEANRGCSHGKNRLAAEARSAWLHFCDADDDRYPNLVETARRWMEAPEPPDVVLLNYEDRTPSGELLLVRDFDDAALREDPVRATILLNHVNCGIYRREALLRAGGFDEDPAVLWNEDDAFHLRLAAAGLRFRAEKEVCAVIVQNPGSMSRARPLACLRATFRVLEKAGGDLPPAHGPALALRLWRCAGALGGYGDWDTAVRCVRLASRLGFRAAPEGRLTFRLISRVSPVAALRLREVAIRLLKPHLRRDLRRDALGETA